MAPLYCEPPTDPQLGFIRKLCLERSQPFPDAVCSKQESSVIIEELRGWTYRPEKYAMPFTQDAVASTELEDVPF